MLKNNACDILNIKRHEKITIELDHLDGNSNNNNLNNLRILCPNCHSQTPTFRSRNNKNILISIR